MQTGKRRQFPAWLIGIAALALAALACEPPPVTGINCLYAQESGAIVAPEDNNLFVSDDGGMSWHTAAPIQTPGFCGNSGSAPDAAEYHRQPWSLNDPSNSGVVYRFNPNNSIERSDDGGATWRQEVDLSGTESRAVYYTKKRGDGYTLRTGPMDALLDPRTGNLVVAMAYEGVLVRTPDARWHWVSVGNYSRVDMRDLSISLPLILNEISLAVTFALVITSTLRVLFQREAAVLVIFCVASSLTATFISGLSIRNILDWLPAAVLALSPLLSGWWVLRHSKGQTIALIWAGAGWTYLLAAVLLLMGILGNASVYIDMVPPLAADPTQSVVILMAYLASVMFILLMLSELRDNFRTTLLLAGLCIICAAGISAVYFLWAIGGIPFYSTATLISISIGLGTLVMSILLVRRSMSAIPPAGHVPPDR